jgi:hypothetical protein
MDEWMDGYLGAFAILFKSSIIWPWRRLKAKVGWRNNEVQP